MKRKLNFVVVLAMIFIVTILLGYVSASDSYGFLLTAKTTYKISGYLKPDTNSSALNIKADFKIAVCKIDQDGKLIEKSTINSDSNGYFSCEYSPQEDGYYWVQITKDGYLRRVIKNLIVNTNMVFGTVDDPVLIWAGDIPKKGIQDDTINMADVMEIALRFNTIKGEERYNVNSDLNRDDCINMADVLIIARHFNITSLDYGDIITSSSTVVKDLKVYSKANKSATVTWTIPDGDISTYNIYSNGILLGSVDAKTTTYTINNLEYCSTNSFEVESISNNKSVGRSEPLKVTLDLVLEEDLTISKDFVLNESKIDLNTHNLTIQGNLRQNVGTIDLNLGKMNVTGNYIQTAGTLLVDGGKLKISGDYRIVTPGDTEKASSGVLNMTKYIDHVIVNGDFKTYSSVDHTEYLNNRILEIKGDFVQKSASGGSETNFFASNKHKVIMNGSDAQNIHFDSDKSSFNIFEINKPLECYVFSTSEPLKKFGFRTMAAPESTPKYKRLVEQQRELAKFGNPGVDRATGNFSMTVTDMVVKSPGFDLAFGRIYNSKDKNDTGFFGNGWRWSYDWQMESIYYGSFDYKNIIMPNGCSYYFSKQEDGSYVAESCRSTLEMQTIDDEDVYVFKSVNGVDTTHVWDGSNIVLELNASGEVLNKYVRGIDLIYSENGSGTNTKYFIYNGHGDVVQLTGTDGSVIKTYDYDAFGNEVNADTSDTNLFRYCGEYWDDETGTIYLRARYYNPSVGRFLTEDPAEAGLNWYV